MSADMRKSITNNAILICILSRVAEVLMGGLLLFIVVGPINLQSLLSDIVLAIYLCILFEAISGYLVTSSLVILYLRNFRTYQYIFISVCLFLIHAGLFMFFFWPSNIVNAIILLIGGSILIAIIAVVGRNILAHHG